MKSATMFEIISLILHVKCTFTIRFTNIFITSVFLISVIAPTISAPSPSIIAVNHPKHRTVFSTICSNPCGADGEDTSLGRHGFQNPLKLVKNQLNTTLTGFLEINRTRISEAYKSTMNLTEQFVDPTITNKQYEDYMIFMKNLRQFTNEKVIHQILPKLYKRLCLYGIAFQKLSSMVPHTYSSASLNHDRTTILKDLKAELKALICEVETSINLTNTRIPPITKHDITKVGYNWPKKPDRTEVLTMDMSAFFHYKSFLVDSLNVTSQVDIVSTNNRRAGKRRHPKKPKRKFNKKRNTKPRKIVRIERN